MSVPILFILSERHALRADLIRKYRESFAVINTDTLTFLIELPVGASFFIAQQLHVLPF